MQIFLEASQYIDCNHPGIVEKATELKGVSSNTHMIAKACFEYVRDEIKHSNDYQLNPVTCKASDVLQHQTGYCFAKSHLLAALLRANKIPAGLCYQRLTISDDKPPYSLHGLNAVFLPDTGWYRVDARGNKPGVDAQFIPPIESLAFPIITAGEVDLAEIWSAPRSDVITALESSATYIDVLNNLPDIEIISTITSKSSS